MRPDGSLLMGSSSKQPMGSEGKAAVQRSSFYYTEPQLPTAEDVRPTDQRIKITKLYVTTAPDAHGLNGSQRVDLAPGRSPSQGILRKGLEP